MLDIRTILMGLMLCLFIFGISPCPAISGDVRGPYLTDLEPKWAQIVFHTERAKDADWRIVTLHVSPFTTGKYAENQVLDHVVLFNPAVVATLADSTEEKEEFVKSGLVWEEPIAGR